MYTKATTKTFFTSLQLRRSLNGKKNGNRSLNGAHCRCLKLINKRLNSKHFVNHPLNSLPSGAVG